MAAPEYRITEAKCQSKLFVVSLCDIEMINGSDNSKVSLHYLIFDTMSEKTVSIQKTANGHVTTDPGMEYLYNRLASFAATELLFILLLLGAVIGMVKGDASRKTV